YCVRCDASGGAFTITLPTAVGATGKEYLITRTDILASTNLLAVATTSSQTIGGAPNSYLWPGEFLKVESDGANWIQIGRTAIGANNYFMVKNSTNNKRYIAGTEGYAEGSATILTSTTSPTLNVLYAFPFTVYKTTKFDLITFSITTVSTLGNSRVGIYRDNGNCYPG